jgi:predicted MFS family arabinose efflux permease
VFWFRIPFVLAALLFLRDLPVSPRLAIRETFDVVGAVLLVLALSALLATLNRAREAVALPLGVIALVALLAFVRQERRAAHPIIDVTVFRVPGFLVLNLVSVLVNLAAFAVWILVPYFLRTAAEFSFAAGGGVLATSAIGTMVASSIGGRLLDRVPARWMAVSGAGLIALGQTLVGSIWRPDTPVIVLLATLLVQGSGLGLFQIAYTEIVTATIPRQNRGVAGSLVMVTRTLGVISAATMLSLVFQGLAADHGFMAAFQQTFWLAALLALTMAGLLAVGVRR